MLSNKPPIFSFLAAARCNAPHFQRYVSTKSTDPLRILFCGSDEFSIAAMRALDREQRSSPDFIKSIDVVCKEPKRAGRGLKTFREVPLSQTARDLNLTLHHINTFTGWKPPKPEGEDINLIIAVSFGLFVPPRILQGVKYGGLNLHPSMLPDFRGPAPLHHILLCGEKNIGLSLQTLHAEKFDEGQILAQSEYPGFKHSCSNVPDLLATVAPKAAEMLVKGLRDLVYVPPMQEVGWPKTRGSIQPVRHAPKITREDSHIDWDTWPAERILRTHRVVGPLWNVIKAFKEGETLSKRVIWSDGFKKFPDPIDVALGPGHAAVYGLQSGPRSVVIKTCDNNTLQVYNVKIEGARETTSADREFKKLGIVEYPRDPSAVISNFAMFRERLE